MLLQEDARSGTGSNASGSGSGESGGSLGSGSGSGSNGTSTSHTGKRENTHVYIKLSFHAPCKQFYLTLQMSKIIKVFIKKKKCNTV